MRIGIVPLVAHLQPILAKPQPDPLVAPEISPYLAGMTTKKKPRLTRDRWLEAGLAALSEAGPTSLQAEPLARQLGTTKGSFYWHFTDLPAFHTALLEQWEQDVSHAAGITDHDADNATARLRASAEAVVAPDAARLETALRAWGLGHAGAAAAIARVDARRHAHLSALLRDIGVSNPEMTDILQAAGIGMQTMANTGATDAPRAMGSLVDLVLALR